MWGFLQDVVLIISHVYSVLVSIFELAIAVSDLRKTRERAQNGHKMASFTIVYSELQSAALRFHDA